MRLGFVDHSSFFLLSQFNLYLIVLLLVLGCSLGRARFGALKNSPSSTLVHQSPRGAWLMLVFSFLVVLFLPLLTIRGLEFSGFSAGLHTSAASFKWLLFVYVVGASVIYLLAYLTALKFSFAFVEFFVAAFLLVQVWAWLSLQTN
jgi:hypothetical protein